jgi:hypothetical protein
VISRTRRGCFFAIHPRVKKVPVEEAALRRERR